MVKVYSKPKVVYFIRHLNDFSYTEELLRSVTESVLIFYGPVSLEREISNRAQSIGVTFYSASRYYDEFFIVLDRLLNALTSRLIKENKLCYGLKYFKQSFLNKFVIKRIKKIISDENKNIKSVNCYAFDHTINPLAMEIIKALREINNFSIPVISLPHGAYVFENTMLDAYDLFPNEKINYKLYDYVVCNDRGHEKIIEGNNVLIPNLKYTADKVIDSSLRSISKTKNLKILILHTKFVGNIFENEFKRCVRILSKFNELDVLIRPHPRGAQEVKRCLGANFKYSKFDVRIEDDIRAADAVIMFGTTAVFDAFLMRKPVFFPKYATSNQINPEILNECNIANTPDEFYELISKFVNKSNQLKIPNWKFPIKKDLERIWNSFFASLEVKVASH